MEQARSAPLGPDVGAAAERAERLRRFRGAVDGGDREMAAFWREQSPAEHGRAMAELSNYAQRIAEQTGYVRDPSEPLPRFPPARRTVDGAAS